MHILVLKNLFKYSMLTHKNMKLKQKKRVLVTSALPYVNNVPHLGNIIGSVLSADVFARFCKSFGYECIYICGTDEHGTATETKALEEGVSPQEICDKYYVIHKKIYEWFNIGFDSFGRTSTQEHAELTQEIFLKLNKNGYITRQTVEQLYCRRCKSFLADRFVEGTCPKCGYEDARGDQCDSCGTLLNAQELIEPSCKVCRTKPQVRQTEHLFIDLPKIEPLLVRWMDRRSVNWSSNAQKISYAWIKEGLKQRAITRDLRWGVPVPYKGFEEKVFYVWFDAPIGYISITKKAFPQHWKGWWYDDYDTDNPKGVKLYQFMGKDNVPFHTVIFPSSLLGTNDAYTMLYTISSTEYLNYEDTKFSKSRGIGVFGDTAMETGIPADVFRYYLIRNRPERSDSTFSWDDLLEKTNNELVANLGNLVNRTLTFVSNFFDRTVPEPELGTDDRAFIKSIQDEEKKLTELLEKVELKEGLRQVMHISRLANQYLQEQAPWKMIKEKPARAKTTLYILVQIVKDLGVMIEPYMPASSENIFKQLNIDKRGWDNLGKLSIKAGHAINEPKILFKKLEKQQTDELKRRFSGEDHNRRAHKESGQQSAQQSGSRSSLGSSGADERDKRDVFALRLKVGRIIDVSDHPDADKLLVIIADCGDEKRQLVAGIKSHYAKEDLVGKDIVVVSNLKPAKLRGVESQGMVLAAEKEGIVRLIDPSGIKPGTILSPEGMDVSSEKITIKEFAKVTMTTKDGFLVLGSKRIGNGGMFACSDLDDGADVR